MGSITCVIDPLITARGVSCRKLHRNYPTMWVSLLFEGYSPVDTLDGVTYQGFYL